MSDLPACTTAFAGTPYRAVPSVTRATQALPMVTAQNRVSAYVERQQSAIPAVTSATKATPSVETC